MEIKLVKGDITKIEVDVVVNAANASLMGGIAGLF
jgi:O-acetyl-ADP-ribose deacetylase (regulator of RNase III)